MIEHDRTANTAESAVQLRIDKAVYGGAGLARQQGKAVFVPYSLPGELVTASVTREKTGFSEAALQSVLEPSPARAEPPCPYFGVCGGCHYQHASYEAQLEMKRAILGETLTRAGLGELPAIVTHAGQPWGYRSRIRLHIDPSTSALGYWQRGAHRLVLVDRCPIAAPVLERALVHLDEVGRRQQWGGFFCEVELSVNHDGSELLLAFWLCTPVRADEASARLQRLCDDLEQRLPSLRGAGVLAPQPLRQEQGRGSRHSRSGQRSGPRSAPADDAPGALLAKWGVPDMTYHVGTLAYRVSLGAFFQGNRTLVAELVTLATAGRSGLLAWDLYAGVGLFSRVLAGCFDKVVAVEGAPISFEDLRFHLAAPHQAVQASTLDFLRRQVGQGERGRPGFVLVDPPRAGLGPEVVSLLARSRPKDVTYVSCDPATFARDLRGLVDSGYTLQQLHLIDLFPQTFHLEAVAMLSHP